jgi:hypothetical protein
MTERLATERWINAGGRLASEAVIERELRAPDDRPREISKAGRPVLLLQDNSQSGR